MYLILFKLGFDIIDMGLQFMPTAFQLFDTLLAYAPYLLRLGTPSGLFAYMHIIVGLLTPGHRLGGIPEKHRQLRNLLRRQLFLTSRAILGSLHPVTVVCEALLGNCSEPDVAEPRCKRKGVVETSNACLQHVVDQTAEVWGEGSAQAMIVACHYTSGLRGDGLSVAWAGPDGALYDSLVPNPKHQTPALDATQHRRPVPALDELAVLAPIEGGTSITFSTSILTPHEGTPDFGSTFPAAMGLFAAMDDLQKAGMGLLTAGRPDAGQGVAHMTRALLNCLAVEDAVKLNAEWRLRSDGNYALALRPSALSSATAPSALV